MQPSPLAGKKSTIEPTVKLTQDQIDFYHREGYLTIDAITTPEEVEWVKDAYDELFNRRAGRDTGDQFDLGGSDEEGKKAVLPQILMPSKYAPELKNTLYFANAEAIAKQLLGDQVIPSGEHAIFKPAHYGAETPWHQDEAYWGEEADYNSFSLWMPLQPATLENGCLQFVPRSHKGPIVEHRPIGNDMRVHGLEMLQPPSPDKVVACPIPAGGCTIHHNRMFHYAGPNRSDIPRRAYILLYGLPATPAKEKRDYFWNRQKQTARAERARLAETKA